jgi:4-amino-4-deoxy-L-arabinose transferase-like glycosyltransferase
VDRQNNPPAGAFPMIKPGKRNLEPDPKRNKDLVYFLVLSSIGVILRLIKIGSRPIWYDEAIAILVSRSGLQGIIRSALSPSTGVSANVHPPLYFSTLWAWMEIFGENPYVVRLLSVLISVLVMIVLWAFTKSLFSRRAGLIAVGLYVLSPYQVHYGQEARMYAMMSLFLLIAAWALWRMLQAGGTLNWVILGASSALAVYTQTLAVVFLICLYMLPLLSRRWELLRDLVFAGVLALLIYSPWLVHLPAQFNRVQAGYWIERPGMEDLIQTLLTFGVGLPLMGFWLPVGLAVSVLLLVLLIWQTYKVYGRLDAHSHRISGVIILAIAPIAVLFLISQIWPVYIIRALLTSGIFYIMWAAYLLSEDRIRTFDRRVIAVVVLAASAIGLFNFYLYRGFPYAPFEEVNEFIQRNISEDGIILHSNKITMLPAFYYDPKLPHEFLADQKDSGSDTLAVPTQEVIGIHEAPDPKSAIDNHQQVFFVIFARELHEYSQAGIRNHPALEVLQSEYRKESIRSFGDLLVYEFINQDN